MKTKWYALVLVPAVLAGCKTSETTTVTTEPPEPQVTGEHVTIAENSPQLTALSVEQARPCENASLRLNGRLVWDDDVTVRIFTPFGGRVTKIAAEIGQMVAPGDTLATIASPDFGQAQADSRKAESDLALAEKNLNRFRELFEHGAAPQKDLQSAEADVDRARFEKERTTARLALYGVRAASIDQTCPLKSPLAGMVVEKNINPGQEVRPDQMLANAPQLFSPLFVVTDPSRLWVQVDATEEDLPKLKVGQKITVHSRAHPDQPFVGKIEVISHFVDPVSRTVKVRGVVDNPNGLLKGEMYVTVESPEDTGGLDVSQKAVYLKGDKHYLFLEDGKGQFTRREIKVGPEHDGRILILNGVAAGQKVVTEGTLLLEQLLQNGNKS
ncbi:MAG: Efflux transporter, family, subunit [Verrucomicrobiales bacterium]|nr:Efflux transporter, family, subunit [Verrucomicrobiales bacterium]